MPRPMKPVATTLSLIAVINNAQLAADGPDGSERPQSTGRTPNTQSDAGTVVTGVTSSSAQVRPGDLFAALPGRSGHGARFVDEAQRRGAVAILTDAAGLAQRPLAAHRSAAIPSAQPSLERLPYLIVDDVRASLGSISSQIYDYPSVALQMIGITGTSGKTTTSYFVRAGLQAAGVANGLIGTVSTLIGDESVSSGFTTPEAPELQALLAVMRERGARSVTMEVSSHALELGRADGIDFAVSAFTNLSQDHLDFHPDMESYFQAKAKLFDRRTLQPVVMVDDDWGRRLATQLGASAVTVSTDPAREAHWQAEQITVDDQGRTRFHVRGPGVRIEAGCSVPGRYNVANALLALVILQSVGVPLAVAGPAVAAASVPGRMERVEAGQPFLVVVDYSHKPAAIEGALAALRPLTRGRLITVLGCGGDRDRAKRPIMGAVAARDSDVFIITDDNPRSEDPSLIRAAMVAGARQVPIDERAELVEIGDRAAAIGQALQRAQPGDTVLIAGKGHEPGQEIQGEIHPFDDRAVARAGLAS